MPEYTANYNLIKPGYDETADIKVINENMDTIDGKLKENADGLSTHVAAAAPHSGHETPAGAQAKVDAAEARAKAYTDQEVAEVSQALDTHVAESAIHKTSDVIRTETNTQLKVEVISSSVSETPDAGRIIFDTSQGKFFGGNGTEWV